MSKADYAEFKFAGALTEEDDFDLLVMGRTQGKGCYCFVNGLLQNQLAKLYPNYPFMVVDNEAGMEHISVVYFREWIQLFWSVTAQEEEYRPLRESRS